MLWAIKYLVKEAGYDSDFLHPDKRQCSLQDDIILFDGYD